MKKLVVFLTVVTVMLVTAKVAMSKQEGHGILEPKGVPLYVVIEVNWDGLAPKADWTVWGPKWEPKVGVGVPLTSCTNCLDVSGMNFRFVGSAVQFDEVYVPTVNATPQVRKVVLHDVDGNGTYTGSLPAAHYFPWAAEPNGEYATLYSDRIDYDVTFDGNHNLVSFHYLQYEHKKLPN